MRSTASLRHMRKSNVLAGTHRLYSTGQQTGPPLSEYLQMSQCSLDTHLCWKIDGRFSHP